MQGFEKGRSLEKGFSCSVCFTLILLLFVGCRGKDAGPVDEYPGMDAVLSRYMPVQMADGIIKVAIVRNLTVGDHTRQFLAGSMAEGRDLGFTVDTFITGGDNERCRELILRIASADYDGLILSHGEADFTYDALKPAMERGIRVVTFDALPYQDGDPIQGIARGLTSTAQEDTKLAEISLEAILGRADHRPARIIRAWFGPGHPPLDRRQQVYDRLVREGKITELAVISPRDFAASRGGIRSALASILPDFPPGTVDAIWAPYDEFAKGCIDALAEADREDIKLVSIDISNDDIALMLNHPEVWVAVAAVDPKLIGIVNMRILAAKFAGEPTPDMYDFEAQLVETSSLSRQINMGNIAEVVPGWGRKQGLFDHYPWMAEIKAAGERRFR